MARTVGIGHQDFEDIRRKGIFYIDKTDFIREWWDGNDSVTLITRPRRFGKTLNMGMVENSFRLPMRAGEICSRGCPYGKGRISGNCREPIR